MKYVLPPFVPTSHTVVVAGDNNLVGHLAEQLAPEVILIATEKPSVHAQWSFIFPNFTYLIQSPNGWQLLEQRLKACRLNKVLLIIDQVEQWLDDVVRVFRGTPWAIWNVEEQLDMPRLVECGCIVLGNIWLSSTYKQLGLENKTALQDALRQHRIYLAYNEKWMYIDQLQPLRVPTGMHAYMKKIK
jgi:hypothetical protein